MNSKTLFRRMTAVLAVKTQRRCISSHLHLKNGSPTAASNQIPEIIIEKKGKLKLYYAASSIKRSGSSFGSPSEGSPIVVRRPSGAFDASLLGLISRIPLMKENIVRDRG